MFTLLLSNNENKHLVNRLFLSNNVYAIRYVLKFIKSSDDVNRLNLVVILNELIQLSTCEKNMCLLIERLHTVNAIHEHLDNLLTNAIQHKRFAVVRYLLLKGANAELKDTNNKSLIHQLIDHRQSGLVQLLIEHYDVDVNSLNTDGENMIFSAISNNDCNLSGSLIQLGTRLDCKDCNGVSLIQRCIENNFYLHLSHIINKGGIDFVYDRDLFHRYCHLAIQVNSMLIFDKLIKNRFAYVIQKQWKSYKTKLRM